MKSTQVVRQLKNHQHLCRKQFLLRCQVARRTGRKSANAIQQHCCETESGGQSLEQKPFDTSDTHCQHAFHVGRTTTDVVQPIIITPLMANTDNTSVTETTDSCSNGIWSKSDSAFLSFTNASNSQSAL